MKGVFLSVLISCIIVESSQCRFELPYKTDFPTSNNSTTIVELVEGLGLIYEGFTVITDDGYLINLNRLVHPCRKMQMDKGIPILMVHGMFMHSDGWLLQAVPTENLAVNWLMKGYDVWLGDQRGSMRSQGHLNLSTKQSKFWDFTFHESGVYDLPAFVDFILNTTGHPKLVYTGLSLGTTFHMVMCSERPEYNNKLYGAIDFVPVGFQPVMSSIPPAVQMNIVYIRDAFRRFQFQNIRSQFRRPQWCLTDRKYECVRIYLHRSKLATLTLTYLESNAYYVKNMVTIKRELANVCLNTPQAFMWYINVFMGAGGNFKPEHFCWQFTTMFSGTSVIVALHTIQLFETANFTRYDYGEAENIRRYGHPEPPAYDLSKVTSPVAFYTSEQDSFSPSHVVDIMLDMFSGVTYRCSVQNTHHLDINFGIQFKRIIPDVNLLLDSLTGRSSPVKMHSGQCPTKISRFG